MNNMKEISRRSMFNIEEGMACGPVSTATADAEITIDNNGDRVYLHGQWIDELGGEIFYEATKESIYDIYEKLYKKEGNFDELMAECDRVNKDAIQNVEIYNYYFEEIKKMISYELDKHDIEFDFDEEEEE